MINNFSDICFLLQYVLMTNRMERLQQRWLPWLKSPYGIVVHHCVVTMLVIPLCLAAIGGITEYAIYKPAFNPHFLVQWMPIAGLVAVPYILIRVFWKWPAHLLKLEVLIYVIQTVAYGINVSHHLIAGRQFYFANRAIRSMLTTNENGVDLFSTVTTEHHVWNWLDHAVTTVFSQDKGRSFNARPLNGNRLLLISGVKLRQHRVTPRCCSTFFRTLLPNTEATNQCYPPFSLSHESRATYGTNLTFPYVMTNVSSYTGHPIDPFANAAHAHGAYGSYPLVGFLTLLSPHLSRETALQHLRDMRESRWIDEQTRAITLEVAMTAIDDLKKPVWMAVSFLLERDNLGIFIPDQPAVHFNYFDASTNAGTEFAGGQPLDTCNTSTPSNSSNQSSADLDIFRCVKLPISASVKIMYVTIVPIVIYTAYLAVRGLMADWKLYIIQPFHWTQVVWAILLVGVVGYVIRVPGQEHCGTTLINQTRFDRGNGSLSPFVTEAAWYAEYLPLASVLTDIRRLLALSMFFHIFNSLRFLVRLKSLGMLVRTLHFSYSSLFSFSLSFAVIFIGFVVLFYMVFSLDAEGFRDVPRTILTLWLGMLGEVQITPELYRSRDWSIALFIFFTFISVFVLLTMIISIISNAYDRVQKEAYSSVPSTVDSATDIGDDLDEEPASPPPRSASQMSSRRQTLINSDFTQLVSEIEVLSSTVQKWRRTSSNFRPSRISPAERSEVPIIEMQETSANGLAERDNRSSSSDISTQR